MKILKRLTVSFILCSSPLLSSELLLKSGEAFLIDDVNESADVVSVRWKGRQYRIPKYEVQRIDYERKGPESSYFYHEIRLTDGSVMRAMIVERHKDHFVFKNDLGFVQREKSKIQNLSELEKQNDAPDLPDKYLSGRSGENLLYVGGSIILQGNLGQWNRTNPGTAGLGFFIEKGFVNKPLWFYGFLSEFSAAPSAHGSISLWNQSGYLGKQWGSSAPYFLFGGGITGVQWTHNSKSQNGIDPEILGEFGWAWEFSNGSRLRLGLRSQCTFEASDSLCRSGLRISWGLLL
ncbi:hypothetical protein EHQ76_06630 [Leptospira barantonii]|uniref:Uncharacterized protein n=1 Tax=Leptospira barantonii TaxID=2023184 RepID=A0A5F2BP31_9LEPT|nr:hypothetical protein [Leptospira barantonii]TGM05940.1 hypothetical protein EHQ76_06630 [Leptospira barantonii]